MTCGLTPRPAQRTPTHGRGAGQGGVNLCERRRRVSPPSLRALLWRGQMGTGLPFCVNFHRFVIMAKMAGAVATVVALVAVAGAWAEEPQGFLARAHSALDARANSTEALCTNNNPPPGSKYTCQQQKSWGKCSEPWMRGYCCSVCGGGGGGGGGGTGGIPAEATHYSWPSGGNSCHSSTGNCIAISDGFRELWSGELGISGQCESVPYYGGSCSSCGDHHAPSCPYGELCSANGGSLCVRCSDSAGVCKHSNWLRVRIADAVRDACGAAAVALPRAALCGMADAVARRSARTTTRATRARAARTPAQTAGPTSTSATAPSTASRARSPGGTAVRCAAARDPWAWAVCDADAVRVIRLISVLATAAQFPSTSRQTCRNASRRTRRCTTVRVAARAEWLSTVNVRHLFEFVYGIFNSYHL